MSTKPRHRVYDRILIDLNTQCDFLLPGGAMPVANRAEALPRIRDLMNWARTEQVPVISSLEAHRPGESVMGLPSHCIDRTRGQRKLPFTLMPRRIVLHGDNTLDVPSDPFRRHQQVIFTKRDVDFLSNPKTDRLINALSPHCWIIFGVTATHCVKAMVLGLLARQHTVAVVSDACGYWSPTDGHHAFRQMDAKGAILGTTQELIDGQLGQRIEAARLMKQAACTRSNGGANGKNGTADSLKALREVETLSSEASGSNDTGGNGAGGNGRPHPDPTDLIPARLLRRKAPSGDRHAPQSRRDLA